MGAMESGADTFELPLDANMHRAVVTSAQSQLRQRQRDHQVVVIANSGVQRADSGLRNLRFKMLKLPNQLWVGFELQSVPFQRVLQALDRVLLLQMGEAERFDLAAGHPR